MPTDDVKENEQEEIKEYHFHIYFYHWNERSTNSATKLWDTIKSLNEKGFFTAVPIMKFFKEQVGPHIIGSFGVWCPKEHFSRFFSWLVLNRGEHSVLIHPLTTEEFLDHTIRGTWMGTPLPLDEVILHKKLDKTPLEFPELGLGYSAKK